MSHFAIVFCAVSAAVDSGAVDGSHGPWQCLKGAEALSAEDPRFGLLAALNLLVVPLLQAEQPFEIASQRRRVLVCAR